MIIDQQHYTFGDSKESPMANESTLTIKGQTTMPAEVRKRIGAQPGTRLVWHVLPTGAVLVRAKTHSILDLAGMLTPPDGRHVTIEEMNPWR